MKIVMGADEAGYELKELIKNHLEDQGHKVMDCGVFDNTPVLYPDVANEVAQNIKREEGDRGILICGTGIGMSITANKVPGIRAAVCHDPFSAERARKSNNAQIMCMGARVIGSELAKMLVDIWMQCEFAGGRSLPKVERINYYDDVYKKSCE